MSCGFAAVGDVTAADLKLEDTMDSFFLSETLKYLYLLFDDDHSLHHMNVIFTTEGHPFPLLANSGRKRHDFPHLEGMCERFSPDMLEGTDRGRSLDELVMTQLGNTKKGKLADALESVKVDSFLLFFDLYLTEPLFLHILWMRRKPFNLFESAILDRRLSTILFDF